MKERFFGYRSFMPEYDAMKRFRAAGVDTVTMMISNGFTASGHPYTKFQPIWVNDNTYDLDMIDRQIAGITDAVPDARIIFYIDLNTPMWWHRRKYWRMESFNQLGRICADPEWRRDTAEYFKVILSHIENNHRDRVAAYIYTAGGTTEWFDLSGGSESDTKFAAYREWCIRNGYPEPADIPPTSVRDCCPRGKDDFASIKRYASMPAGSFYIPRLDGNGLLRTPVDNEEACRYWKFCNDLIADTVIFFAKAAREVIRPEVQLGTTFGYSVDVLAPEKTHNGYLDVFDAPELDFFLAPATYCARHMGEGSGSLLVSGSAMVRGKRILNSCDHRTYTSRNLRSYDKNLTFWNNDDEVRAGMKREFSMNFINGCSTWWFDMMGGWWDSDAAMETVKSAKSIWDRYAAEEPADAFETMVVCQPENYNLINIHHPAAMDFFKEAHLALSQSSVPFSIGSLADLELFDPERIKLWIFQHPFRFTDAEWDLVRRKVLRNGNTVVWLYAPGVINAAGEWDEKNVERLCGIPFGTPGVAVKEMDGWRSIVIRDPGDINADLMAEIVAGSGIHRWCDKNRPVFANADFAAIHTGVAGKLHLMLPSKCRTAVELFSGREWHDTDTIELTSNGPETWLFRYTV